MTMGAKQKPKTKQRTKKERRKERHPTNTIYTVIKDAVPTFANMKRIAPPPSRNARPPHHSNSGSAVVDWFAPSNVTGGMSVALDIY